MDATEHDTGEARFESDGRERRAGVASMTSFVVHPLEHEPHAPSRARLTPRADGSLVAAVREAIEALSGGDDFPTIGMTAEFVGMSVRTLQRRLARAGACHHELVAQARFATAAAVLERTDAKILALALDLGYSDHANFTRAFRRWAGCSPREYRSRRTSH